MPSPAPVPLQKLALVGCGKMGGALLSGWLRTNMAQRYVVIEPGPLPETFSQRAYVYHIKETPQAGPIFTDVQLLVLAVKPQMLEGVCAELHPVLPAEAPVISIAAGVTLDRLTAWLPGRQIVRCMPNTPAAVGKGMSVAIASAETNNVTRDLATRALSTTGLLEWTQDEGIMNAVTALSGSGPAYVFYLIEALAAAGEKLGLAPDLAMRLARQTVIGSASLAESDPDTTVSRLRAGVTSPGGTTEAALKILMDGKFQDVLSRAMSAAADRGRELGE